MLNGFYSFARPLLFALAPEDAHEATLRALEAGLYPRARNDADPILRQSVFGLEFPNPLGIAAGYDKDARVPDAVLGLGCGFAEVGTVTPRPQPGNPKPRVFRLLADHGLINRLGFNNAGHQAAHSRLLARRGRGGIVGVNIGANKDSADRAADYADGIVAFSDVASYFTINISSPNTPGLRDLQAPAELDKLLRRVLQTRDELGAKGSARRPIIVKISPDIAEADIPAICGRLAGNGVDGIAVSNTTLSRTGLTDPLAAEVGGLSGRPIFERATAMLALVYKETGGKIPIIGIGGIDSPKTALAKIEAGATLLQVYTGLIYEGPGLIGAIGDHLAREARSAGPAGLAAIRGRKADYWASQPLV